MSGLSREVLKWLQSLDLSVAVKNPRRDFSDGLLVAEILYRYFPHDVQLHSFHSACNAALKEENWRMLLKVFARTQFLEAGACNKAAIEPVMHCAPGAAVAFVHLLYEGLTKRKAPQSQQFTASTKSGYHNPCQYHVEDSRNEEDECYMRPTVAYLMREPEVVHVEDTLTHHHIAHKIIDAHEVSSEFHLQGALMSGAFG
eukprot:GHVU01170831.1.p1 GENE.GHVU01170831.1~~GHVU01170831.1.p1  ORF type:complete len:200 (+),score=21.95 GHVU01170831.1:73-672(+)